MTYNNATQYQSPTPEKAGRQLRWWHIVLSMLAGAIIATVSIVAIAFAIPEESVEEGSTSEVGGGNAAASQYLSDKGINIEPELVGRISTIVCDGMDSGNTGSQLIDAVQQTMDGINYMNASELVAASMVYTCPEHIGKLAR
ncbi:DUF732 domain-containing protein [Corynebacterium striatum]